MIIALACIGLILAFALLSWLIYLDIYTDQKFRVLVLAIIFLPALGAYFSSVALSGVTGWSLSLRMILYIYMFSMYVMASVLWALSFVND